MKSLSTAIPGSVPIFAKEPEPGAVEVGLFLHYNWRIVGSSNIWNAIGKELCELVQSIPRAKISSPQVQILAQNGQHSHLGDFKLTRTSISPHLQSVVREQVSNI